MTLAKKILIINNKDEMEKYTLKKELLDHVMQRTATIKNNHRKRQVEFEKAKLNSDDFHIKNKYVDSQIEDLLSKLR
jgi:ribosomal protein S17